MGQSFVSPTPTHNADFLSSFDELDTPCDLGTILSHKLTKETYLLKDINMPDQQEFGRSLKLFQDKKQCPRENVLNLVHLSNQSKSLFCSEIYRISMVFEFTSITLSEEIEARQPQCRYFDEQDLWSILQSCLCGLMEIRQSIILQPSRVYIMDEGLIKIIDPDMMSGNTWSSLDQNIYYCPERFENFGNLNRINTTQEEAMFSLGMTLLHTALLDSCFDCYDYDSRRFSYTQLLTKTHKLHEICSEDLRTVVCGLVETDPAKRMGIAETQDFVQRVMNQENQENQDTDEQYSHNIAESRLQQSRQSHIQNPSPLRDIQNHQSQPNASNQPPLIKFKNVEIITSIDPNLQSTVHPQIHSSIQQYSSFSYKQQKTLTIVEHQYPCSSDIKLESVSSKNQGQRSMHFGTSNTKDHTSFYKTQRERDEDLFTDPKLIQQIRRDINQITARRSLLPTTSTGTTTAIQTNNYNYAYNSSNYSSQHTNYQNRIIPASLSSHSPPQPEVHNEEDGKVFEGRLVNGKKEGFGKLSYPEGPFYLGNFHNDKMHGEGGLFYEEGKPAYNGEWLQDQFHGSGTLYNENPVQQNEPFDFSDFNMVEDFWIKYQGQFVSDNKEGHGRLYLSNGQSFQGLFQRDYINGKGVFLSMEGKSHNGRWDNNILQEELSRS